MRVLLIEDDPLMAHSIEHALSSEGIVTEKAFLGSHGIDSSKVFDFDLAKLVAGTLPEFVEVWHEGCCGKCGKRLTVPSSIENGLGPECIKTLTKMEKRDKFLQLILG